MKSNVKHVDENNNENKILIAMLDSELGYYYQVIRSMLAAGHETELIFWFRSMALIPSEQVCQNSHLNEDCNKVMEWAPAKTKDYYQWVCQNCAAKKSIRSGSFLQDVKCSFNNVLRLLLGWCKGYDMESMSTILDIKKHIIKTMYSIITEIAMREMRRQLTQNQLGGPGSIVIIDTYPNKYFNALPIRNGKHILCIVEVKDIPPKYYFECLDRSRSRLVRLNDVIQLNLQRVQEIVKPGTTIVASKESQLCSYDILQSLKHLYPNIVSINGLERHNTPAQTIDANLHTIWQPVIDLCDEAQLLPPNEVANFLSSQMWQAQYGDEAFEAIINHLSEMSF